MSQTSYRAALPRRRTIGDFLVLVKFWYTLANNSLLVFMQSLMQPKIHIGGALKVGWEMLKEHVLLFLGGGFVSAVLLGVPLMIFTVLFNGEGAVSLILGLLFFVVYLFVTYWLLNGWLRVLLDMYDQKPVSFSMIFTNIEDAGRLFLADVLLNLIVTAGYFVFIIPGVIFSIMFSQTRFFIVDKKMGVLDAMKASAHSTDGHKWDVLGFMLVAGIVTLLGLLGFFVGIIFTVIIAQAARVAVYRALA